jgi:hypothetical protein
VSKGKTSLTLPANEWVPFGEAFTRILACVGAVELALYQVRQDMLDGRLKAAKRDISTDGSETVTLLKPSGWQQLKVFEPDTPGGSAYIAGNFVGGHFFVRRADLDKHYPIAATPTMTAAHPSDGTRPPERRRGPATTHDWHTIDGEIARRCINPTTGRVAVPKKEHALASEMRTWCKDQGWAEPAISEMSEAVRRICAALRTVQK